MTSLRQLQNTFAQNKASKAFGKAASKDSKSRACQSKQPAYCPYHGASAPDSRADVAAKLVAIDSKIEGSLKKGLVGAALVLEHDKRLAALELEAIDFIKSSSTDKSSLSIGVSHIVNERRRATSEYIDTLANQVFTTPQERLVAKKGSPVSFALRVAAKNDYPVAVWMPNYSDGEFYEKSAEDKLKEETDDLKVREFAKANNLDVLKERSGVYSYSVVPISWDTYGLTKQEYLETANNLEFEEKLRKFKKAKYDVLHGETVSKFEPEV